MEKILVIDDHADVRENIAELLKLQGYLVHQAANGQTGIIMAQKALPDLIVCDVQMPDMDGFEVYRNLGSNLQTRLIPFIFLTGLSDPGTRCQGLNAGIDDYLVKPVCENTLISTIQCRIKKGKALRNLIGSNHSEYVHDLEMILHQFAHVVRSPLCTMLGLVNVLDLEKESSIEEIRFILSQIKASALRFDDCTSSLIQQLLDILVKNKLKK